MNTKLEQDLRHAMAAQAAELPADVSAELLAHDYRPRGATGRAALALAAAALTGAAVFAVSVVGLGSDAPRAFAGWTAAPTAATGNQLSTARSSCRAMLIRMSQLRPPGRPVVAPGAWHTILFDTRGPYTLTLYEAGNGRATSVCFTGSRGQSSLGAGIGTRPPAPVPPGRAAYQSSGSTVTPRDEGSRQFSYVAGRTGAGVTGVTIRLNDGTRVTASRATGWFLAWWPGSHGIRATEVTTAAGTNDQ